MYLPSHKLDSIKSLHEVIKCHDLMILVVYEKLYVIYL